MTQIYLPLPGVAPDTFTMSNIEPIIAIYHIYRYIYYTRQYTIHAVFRKVWSLDIKAIVAVECSSCRTPFIKVLMIRRSASGALCIQY